MNKKIIFCLILIAMILMGASVYADESDGTYIPSMTIEELMLMSKSKQAKVDIIKKNNIEIESLKKELKNRIVEAANKINALKIDVSNKEADISDDVLLELKELLQFLQDSKTTLENDVEKISNEIESILDLISTKGLLLEQYDKLIENQNEVIVKMKKVMNTVNKI